MGYAVPGLLGLYYSAPYLHDGGVAAGPGGELGMAGTLMTGVDPDPRESLRALVDRALREQVMRANAADPRIAAQNVTGEGHPFWVDERTGYSGEEQEALLDYLLALPLTDGPNAALAP